MSSNSSASVKLNRRRTRRDPDVTLARASVDPLDTFVPMGRRRRKEMVDSTILNTTTYLEELSQGDGPEFEVLILQGLELIHVGKGILRCKLLITDRVAGADGIWQAGAITTVMDGIGASAVYSTGDGLYSAVDLNVSFYSTAKIQEKVEIEARVKGTNGRLKSAVIEIRRESNGEIIATGRMWMSPLGVKIKHNVFFNFSKL